MPGVRAPILARGCLLPLRWREARARALRPAPRSAHRVDHRRPLRDPRAARRRRDGPRLRGSSTSRSDRQLRHEGPSPRASPATRSSPGASSTRPRRPAGVRHPHVVQITDFGRFPRRNPLLLVMELLTGRTLGEVIKAGGPIPAARAVRIVEQVAGALAAAHIGEVSSIANLKPDNVFLVGGVTGGQASDDVRVVDFGAAKIIGSSRVTRQGIVFGTPAYMSPEQASGQPIDHRVDVYSLGIIMYEMFAGRVPFEADTYMGVLTQHMFVQPSAAEPRRRPRHAELGALEEIALRVSCEAAGGSVRAPWPQLVAGACSSRDRGTGRGSIRCRRMRCSRPAAKVLSASVRYRMADEETRAAHASPEIRSCHRQRPVPPGARCRGAGSLGAGAAVVLSHGLVEWRTGLRRRSPVPRVRPRCRTPQRSSPLPPLRAPPRPPSSERWLSLAARAPPPSAPHATFRACSAPVHGAASGIRLRCRGPVPGPLRPPDDDIGDPFAAKPSNSD